MTADPTDAIAAALARLRGGRPRPPWAGPPSSDDAPAHDHDHGHGHGWGPGFGGGGRFGGPHERPHRGGAPWPEHGRFGGPARLRLLDALAAASTPLTVSEAAAAIGVDQPRASRLVQQGVQMGLVRREADPDDARRTRIALTEEGSRILGTFRGERRDAVRSALAGFTDAERAELARLLAKLADAWPR
jgi:DNA-binding MarR family transcriptional regulator